MHDGAVSLGAPADCGAGRGGARRGSDVGLPRLVVGGGWSVVGGGGWWATG